MKFSYLHICLKSCPINSHLPCKKASTKRIHESFHKTLNSNERYTLETDHNLPLNHIKSIVSRKIKKNLLFQTTLKQKNRKKTFLFDRVINHEQNKSFLFRDTEPQKEEENSKKMFFNNHAFNISRVLKIDQLNNFQIIIFCIFLSMFIDFDDI